MGGGCTFLLFICITRFFTGNGEQATRREAIEIIIGGGGGSPPAEPPENPNCPPPPPPPCPPPPKPPQPPPPPPPPPPKVTPRPSTPKRPPSPPYDGFESPRLALVYPVIQAFRKKVSKYDPLGITNSWKGKTICGVYKGFVCDKVPLYNQKALAGVKFNNFKLGGPDSPIDDFLMGLPDLVFFHANSNNFTGPIPTALDKLRYFYELDLSNNKFTGSFPYQVLKAKKLLFLDIRFNTFAGVVPSDVFLLNLDLLFINNNNFIQKLPDNLGKTTALYLTLANNNFTGGIPTSIGQASNTLLEVLFLNNKLTGCLPYEIGFLKKATVFDVGTNSLTGPIPHSFQCLKKMEILNLANNRFYGTVPEAVCSLPNLSNFTLSYNYFTQVGLECRKLIAKGVLHVKMNCILDLPNQRSPADCARFFSSPHDSCGTAKSLTYVPCSLGYSNGDNLESSDVEINAPVTAPAQAPRSYGALSPH